MKTINATDFKARCLQLLDEVARTGETIEVLKRGKAVARVVQAPRNGGEFPQDKLRGTITYCGDIISPVLPPEAWEAERRMFPEKSDKPRRKTTRPKKGKRQS